MTKPFATLLDRNLVNDLATARLSGREDTNTTDTVDVEEVGRDAQGLERLRPSNVFVNSSACRTETHKPDGGAVRLGLHMITLVPPAGFEPATHGKEVSPIWTDSAF